ncbi:MAG: protein kinase [Planctomycetota bacterium]
MGRRFRFTAADSSSAVNKLAISVALAAIWLVLAATDGLFGFTGPAACLMGVFLLLDHAAIQKRRLWLSVLAVFTMSWVVLFGVDQEANWMTRSTLLLVSAAIVVYECLPKTRVQRMAAHGVTEAPESERLDFVTDDPSSDEEFDSRLRDGSTVTSLVKMVPSLDVRLRDAGIFSTSLLDRIAEQVEIANDESDGLRAGLQLGLITHLQHKYITEHRERDLRIGRYTLEGVLGRGAMGVVFQATDRRRDEQVALKLFRHPRENLPRIRREMAVIQELAHPNIVTALDVGDEDGHHFIAMEVVRGRTLAEIIDQHGPLPESTSLLIVYKIAEAIEQSHERGILHRDIKPANIMITPDRDYKLMDLGICRPPAQLREYDTVELTGASICGTIGFLAPEQASPTGKVDERSDLFGLGATLYYLLQAEYFVEGETQEERFRNTALMQGFRDLTKSGISRHLVTVLTKMLAPSPDDRYQSVAELIPDVRLLIRDHGIWPDESIVDVLIVEDAAEDLMITKQVLRAANRSLKPETVSTFAATKAFIEDRCAKSERPLVVLMDLALPDSFADQTVNRLAELCCDSVRLVALTGDDDARLRRRCLDNGASEFLEKSQLNGKRIERTIFAALSRLPNSLPAPETEESSL